MRYLGLVVGVVVVIVGGCVIGEDDDASTDGVLAATWGVYDPQPGHPTVDERDRYVAEIGEYAREAEAQYGVPAAALTAMACNESGFGWTRIALNANNLFGWKWTSPDAAGGRPAWVLVGQPASDPNNKYVHFADRRDAVLFVGSKLALNARYKPHTERYVAELAAGVDVKTAANTWVRGIAFAGYNPFEHYPVTTISFMNNYRSPSSTFSDQFNLYHLSAIAEAAWISIDSPQSNAVVRGDVALASTASGSSITTVKFATRVKGAASWYALGEDTAAPFTRTWSTDPWVSDGEYELKAEAWSGATLKATGVITVSVHNVP
jgi:hypothetical protein